MADYIILRASDYQSGGLAKQFWATEIDMGTTRQQSVDRTLSAKPDLSYGAAPKYFKYVILIPEDEDDYASDWGDRGDLEEFYSYDDPNGTPSNVITLVLHNGVTHDVYWVGDLVIKPEGVIVLADGAYYSVPVEFMVK